MRTIACLTFVLLIIGGVTGCSDNAASNGDDTGNDTDAGDTDRDAHAISDRDTDGITDGDTDPNDHGHAD